MIPCVKPTFLTYTKPLLTAMVQAATPDEAISIIAGALYDGAEAFGIQLENLKREYRDEATLRGIFEACQGRPVYITSYRNSESTGYTDEECVEYLLMGLRAGATLCDVMGDFFHPEPHELTYDPAAVRRQAEVIAHIHEMGGEVLMSSHLHAFFTCEETLAVARSQVERGADVVKIVGFAQDEEEMMADLNTIHALKRELNVPFLYLANGAHSRLIRQMGASLGVCMYLCVPEYRPINSKEQPRLRETKQLRDCLG